jgi:hypothetical protein
MQRFDRWRSPLHEFHELDYRDYFARASDLQVGVYLYDGEHSYDNQLDGLRMAEPFLAPGCVVLVDDANWEEPRRATLDFVAASGGEFKVILDQTTTAEDHPTLRNGLIALRKRGGGAAAPVWTPSRAPGASAATRPAPAEVGAEPLVSAIVVEAGDPAAGAGIESLAAQTYPNVEVLVLDEHDDAHGALEASRGDLVCLVHAADSLAADAIEEALGPLLEEGS